MTLPSVAAIGQPRAWGYDGSLNDLLIRLAAAPARPLSLVGSTPEAPKVQTASLPEEFISEFGLTFARSDLSGGEGLRYAHRPNPGDNDNIRYFRGWGCQVVEEDDRSYVQLQPYVRNVSGASFGPGNLYGHYGDYLSLVPTDGDELLRSVVYYPLQNGVPDYTQNQIERIGNLSDPGNETLNYETISASLATPPAEMVRLGDTIYAQCGVSGIWQRSAAAGAQTWTQLSTTNSWGLWAAKGRLFNTDYTTSKLQEVDLSTGAYTLVITNSGQKAEWVRVLPFNHVVDAGAFILAAAWDGYVYALQEVSGSLELIGQTLIGTTEYPDRIAYHPSGTLLVFTRSPTGSPSSYLTDAFLYTASIDSSTGVLTNLQTIKKFRKGFAGGPIGYPTVRRDSIYFNAVDIENTDGPPWRYQAGVWRYSVKTGGLHMEWNASYGGLPSNIPLEPGDVAFVNDEMFAVWRSAVATPDYTTESSQGSIILPLVDFYTDTDKAWISVTVNALDPGGSGMIMVEATSSEDAMENRYSADWVEVGYWDSTGVSTNAIWGEAISVDMPADRWLALQLFLIPNGDLVSPQLVSIQLRATVTSDEFVIDLPVNISDRIEPPGRRPFLSPGWGRTITDALLDMRGSKVDLELFEPPLTATGVIEAIRVDVQQIPESGSATDVATVRFRGTRT